MHRMARGNALWKEKVKLQKQMDELEIEGLKGDKRSRK